MALKTVSKKSEPAAAPAPVEETALLELSLYTNYTWRGVTYEKGKPYRFRTNDAMTLMSELDHGRPVWKLYRPPLKKTQVVPDVVDATEIRTETAGEELMGVDPTTVKPKRIDVGTDDEIKDILDRVGADEEDAGNVTV